MRSKYLIVIVLSLICNTYSFQPDEIELEPFLEVSDTYLKQQKIAPWFGKEHLSLNEQITKVNSAPILLWGETDRVITML